MKAVLIAGASTGIGEACALALSEMDFRVFAGVRKSSDGESLRKEAKGFLTTLSLDVTRQGLIHAAFEHIEAAEPEGLFALVNDAALLKVGPVETNALEAFRSSMEVNYLAPHRAHPKVSTSVPKIRERIVNVVPCRRTSPFLLHRPMRPVGSRSKG